MVTQVSAKNPAANASHMFLDILEVYGNFG